MHGPSQDVDSHTWSRERSTRMHVLAILSLKIVHDLVNTHPLITQCSTALHQCPLTAFGRPIMTILTLS